MGIFIVFEGGDGTGKSTQAKALCERLRRVGMEVVRTREPGGTPLSRSLKLRSLLNSNGGRPIAPWAEFNLFSASRAQLVAEVILPSLEEGKVIVCDRYAASSLAYQGYGRGLDLGLISAMNDAATAGLVPDLVVLLDLSPEHGLARKREMRRFEEESLSFHQRVRQGYLEMAADDPGRWLVVDATLPGKEVQRLVWERVEALLKSS
ncbi:dTMP kinase [Chloroflexota bacterium]